MREINLQQNLEPDLTAKDPYAILGISSTATQVEIKRAYFALIRKYPPETEGEKFKTVRSAYEKIKTAKRRGETDIFLPQAPSSSWQLPEIETTYDTSFHASDALIVLQQWGDLGRTDFKQDFKEIDL